MQLAKVLKSPEQHLLIRGSGGSATRTWYDQLISPVARQGSDRVDIPLPFGENRRGKPLMLSNSTKIELAHVLR